MVLLPPETAIGFLPFAGIYAVSVTAGLLSQVPGAEFVHDDFRGGEEPGDVPGAASMIQVDMGDHHCRQVIRPDTKLGEALDYLQRAYNIPFEINQQAFKDEMIDDVSVKPLGREIPKMKNVARSTVLRKVLERLQGPAGGTTWLIRNGVVEITTARYAASEKAIVAYDRT